MVFFYQLNVPTTDPGRIIENLYQQWVSLSNLGAKHVLMNNFFDFSLLPDKTKSNENVKRLIDKKVTLLHNSILILRMGEFNFKFSGKTKLYLLNLDKLWMSVREAEVSKRLRLSIFNENCVEKTNVDKYNVCNGK